MHAPALPSHCPRPCSLRESHTGGSKGWMMGQKEHDARAPFAPSTCAASALQAVASAIAETQSVCAAFVPNLQMIWPFGPNPRSLAVWARDSTTWSRRASPPSPRRSLAIHDQSLVSAPIALLAGANMGDRHCFARGAREELNLIATAFDPFLLFVSPVHRHRRRTVLNF